MNSQQRIIAAMKCQPVDRIPFVPNLNGYAIRRLAPRYHTMERWQIQQELGIDCLVRFRIGVRVCPPVVIIPPDPSGPTTLLGCSSRQWSKCQPTTDKIKMRTESKNGRTFIILETPIGSLRCCWRFVETSDMPFPDEPLLKSKDDFAIYHYVLDHTAVEPAYEEIIETLKAVGDNGTCEAAGGATPIQNLLEYLCDFENFYYWLSDYTKEMEDLMQHLMEVKRKEYQVLADSPAPIIITGENTSTTMMSPACMAKYEIPALDEFSDILHRRGKIHMVHMCGKINNVLDQLVNCHLDGIHDAAPSPTGDLDFHVAREKLCAAGKCLAGGIDCTAFADLTPVQLEKYIVRRLEQVAPGTGFLMGSGDTVPAGTTIENLKAVVGALECHGRYPLKKEVQLE